VTYSIEEPQVHKEEQEYIWCDAVVTTATRPPDFRSTSIIIQRPFNAPRAVKRS